jgi:hypothetical protein
MPYFSSYIKIKFKYIRRLIMFRSSIIEENGAKFDGIQKVNGRDKFAVATDLQTLSTYYLPIKGLTKRKVQKKLATERKKFKIK